MDPHKFLCSITRGTIF